MEGLISLDSENYGVGGQNTKITGEKTMNSSKVGGAQRKRLSDISNLKEQPKQQPNLLMTYEYVDKLQKENMTLMKVLAERNRIIEISGNELEKLRINFQKLQQQNLQFARANSQMLAELNSSKDRLKALQHELGCKNGVLMARNLDLERKGKSPTYQTREVETVECSEAVESMNADNEDNRPCKTNKRRQSRRESFGPSDLHTEVQNVDGKRPCVRRKSARCKTEEPVATHDILETENSNSTDVSQCLETSNFPGETIKAEGKRPCSRRQSARLKTEEPVATNDSQEIENSNSTDSFQCKETTVLLTEVQKVEGKRPCSKRQSARFEPEEPLPTKDLLVVENSSSNNSVQCKETTVLITEVQKVEGKRPHSKRQSARFESDEPVATKDFFEVKNSNSTSSSQYKETVCESVPISQVQESQRPSVGRSSRRTIGKVPSYKEMKINVKMRREV